MVEGHGRDRRPRWYGEALVIIWLCWAYDAINGLPRVRELVADAHARSVLHLEQTLHLDPERTLNHWLAAHHSIGLWVSNYYDNAHFVVTLGIVGWLWWRHPGSYRTLRTSLVLINVIALIVFWRYPLAPPRLLPGGQFIDVVAATHAFGAWHGGVLANAANQFAAMPSLHIAWAAWSSLAYWRIVRTHRLALLAWLYPLITSMAVMATANHFLLDVVAGVITMVVATLAAEAIHGALNRLSTFHRSKPSRLERSALASTGNPVVRHGQEPCPPTITSNR